MLAAMSSGCGSSSAALSLPTFTNAVVPAANVAAFDAKSGFTAHIPELPAGYIYGGGVVNPGHVDINYKTPTKGYLQVDETPHPGHLVRVKQISIDGTPWWVLDGGDIDRTFPDGVNIVVQVVGGSHFHQEEQTAAKALQHDAGATTS